MTNSRLTCTDEYYVLFVHMNMHAVDSNLWSLQNQLITRAQVLLLVTTLHVQLVLKRGDHT